MQNRKAQHARKIEKCFKTKNPPILGGGGAIFFRKINDQFRPFCWSITTTLCSISSNFRCKSMQNWSTSSPFWLWNWWHLLIGPLWWSEKAKFSTKSTFLARLSPSKATMCLILWRGRRWKGMGQAERSIWSPLEESWSKITSDGGRWGSSSSMLGSRNSPVSKDSELLIANFLFPRCYKSQN